MTVRLVYPFRDQHEQPTTSYQLVTIDDSNVAHDRTKPMLGRVQSVVLVDSDAGAIMIIDPDQRAGPQSSLFGVDD